MELLSIGGFDPTAGAGVIRDILTFRKLGVYGFAVITAVTFQNLDGFYGFHPLKGEDVERQINSLEGEEIKFVKISMVGSGEIAKILEDKIKRNRWFVIFDPLLSAKNGYVLNCMEDIEGILKLAKVIVPNVPEAEIISGIKIKDEDTAIKAGLKIRKIYGGDVIIKGGHLSGVNYLISDEIKKIKTKLLPKTVHGTGCAYSSALMAYLSKGLTLEEAFYSAQKFMEEEMEKSLAFGGSYEVLP